MDVMLRFTALSFGPEEKRSLLLEKKAAVEMV